MRTTDPRELDAYQWIWGATDRRGHAFAVVTDRLGRTHRVEQADHWRTLCRSGPRASSEIVPLDVADVPPCKPCLALFDELVFGGGQPTSRKGAQR